MPINPISEFSSSDSILPKMNPTLSSLNCLRLSYLLNLLNESNRWLLELDILLLERGLGCVRLRDNLRDFTDYDLLLPLIVFKFLSQMVSKFFEQFKYRLFPMGILWL